jgi:hypothetical protein
VLELARWLAARSKGADLNLNVRGKYCKARGGDADRDAPHRMKIF